MKDIAKACGVSAATVSYVLNAREDQRISEDTRQKILHYANLTGYVYSRAARALATGQRFTVGVYAPYAWSLPDRAVRTALLIQRLAEEFERLGYTLIHLTDTCMRQRSAHVDAILAVDPTVSEFYTIGKLNFCPLLCVDGVVDDPVFYMIYDDFAGVAHLIRERTKAGRLALLYDAYRNERIMSRVANAFDAVYDSRDPSLEAAVRAESDDTVFAAFGLANARTLTLLGRNPVVAAYDGEDAPPSSIILSAVKKAGVVVQLVRDILKRACGEQHDIRVL
jgi:DNA-binding LacI/PurR family transcriptional regulator